MFWNISVIDKPLAVLVMNFENRCCESSRGFELSHEIPGHRRRWAAAILVDRARSPRTSIHRAVGSDEEVQVAMDYIRGHLERWG